MPVITSSTSGRSTELFRPFTLLALLALAALLAVGCGRPVVEGPAVEGVAEADAAGAAEETPAASTASEPEAGEPGAAAEGGALPFLVHILDVGQGDAILLQSPTGQNLLYDGGQSGAVTLAHLERLGVQTIDLVVASHGHADHIGGLIDVVRHFRPRFYMDNGVPHTTQTYRRLMEALLEAETQLIEPTSRRIALGDAEVFVLPPPGDPEWEQNDNSVGLVLEWGDFRASFGGDAEDRQWTWWLENHPDRLRPVALHKSSHHGSRSGDTAEGISALEPELIVLSLAADNRYGHPHAQALELYRVSGARVLRTDQHGGIRVEAFRDGTWLAVTHHGTPAQSSFSSPPPTRSTSSSASEESRSSSRPR